MFIAPASPYPAAPSPYAGACPQNPPSRRPSISHVDRRLAHVYGDEGHAHARWCAAKSVATAAVPHTSHPTHLQHLTYGEIDLHVVDQALRRAAVHDARHLVDVGSGYGRAVLAAALLFPHLRQISGVELLRPLHEGAIEYESLLRSHATSHVTEQAPHISWVCDDYRSVKAREVLQTADLALCFATTWGDLATVKLAQLSNILADNMPKGSRAVLVDKELCAGDGWVLLDRYDTINTDTGESTVCVYKLG